MNEPWAWVRILLLPAVMHKKLKRQALHFFMLAGAEGFEPPMLAPETRALPLGDAPSLKGQY
jgi:hypothetical protein